MELLLTPTIVAGIVYAIGLALAVGYLGVLKGKSTDTKRITALLVSWLALVCLHVGYEALHASPLASGPGFNQSPGATTLLSVFQFSVLLSLVLIVYRAGFGYARREERVVFVAILAFLVWTLGVMVVNWDNPGPRVGQSRRVIVLLVAASMWLLLAAIRKLWHIASTDGDSRIRRLVRLTLLATLCVLMYFATTTNAVTLVQLSAETRTILSAITTVLVAGVLVLGTLLYGHEEHGLPVKLAGFLVIAYVSIVSVVIPLTRTEFELRREFATPGKRPSLEFAPMPDGGYVARTVPPRWIDVGGTSHSVADDDAVPVRSRFPIPFHGTLYDSVWVGTNGSVSLGAEIDADGTYSEGQSFFDPVPSAMPIYSDFAMVSGDSDILVEAGPERLVATWYSVSQFDLAESEATFQAAFFPDGRFEFNYGHFDSIPLEGFVGMSPGGPAEETGLPDGSTVVARGQPLFEQWNDRLAYRRFVHRKMATVAWIAPLGLFVVLVAGLLFYRAGLLGPLGRVLAGLRAVEKGDLDAEVVIHERNELGALADHFNSMTSSLRTYAHSMEDLVSRRTADLDRTISDLKATQKQLVEQEKLASLGALTAGIAHEIKNPLNFVNNFAEVNAELADEAREALAAGDIEAAREALADLEENAAQIAKHGKRADSIVRSMMQHARGGTSEKETIHVNVFLEEYAALAWHGMRARDDGFDAELIRDFGEDAGTIDAMPQELGRVILNLLNNAFDAVKGTDGARVTIASRRTEDGVGITVADNGPGIPDEVRDRIFEPFFTTKPTGEGTGLGLSLSYDIVTKGHGGTMTVGESPEGGAMFVVAIPA